LEACARNHEDKKDNFKSNWDPNDQSRAAKKTWQAPWYKVGNKPSPPLQQRRGLFAASGERSPLLVLTILRFTLAIQHRNIAIRQRSTWFDKPSSCDFAAQKSKKLRWRK
jgi:hypothetical protein